MLFDPSSALLIQERFSTALEVTEHISYSNLLNGAYSMAIGILFAFAS
jgi:hypothetical protein